MAGQLLEAFEEILSGKSSDARMQAEASIAEKFETDGRTTAFGCLEIMANKEINSGIRQFAGVLFRRNCFSVMNDDSTFWNVLDGEGRELMRQQLLAMLTNWDEPDNVKLCHRICDCVGAVVKATTLDLSNQLEEAGADMDNFQLPPATEYWSGLLETLFSLTQMGDAQREAALYIYSSVPGIFGQDLSQHLHGIYIILQESINSENEEVRVSAANALSGLIGRMEKEDAVGFSDLMESCVEVVKYSLQNDRKEDAERVLKALVDLTETQPQVFKSNLESIVSTMLVIAENESEEFPDDCRRLALEVCVGLCENRGGMMRTIPDFANNIFVVCVKMIMEIEEDDEWAEMDMLATEEDETVLCGEVALDRIATNLGGKQVMEVAKEVLGVMLQKEDNWKERYAACIALSSIGEGCRKSMREYLSGILDLVLNLFDDENPRVVYSATNVVGQLAVDFAPQQPKEYKRSFAVKYKTKVINGLCNVIAAQDHNPRVQAHATAALVNVVENIRSKDLKNETDLLLECVRHLFHTSFMIVKESAVTLLATVADSCAEHFQTHYKEFIEAMQNIIADCAEDKDKKMLLGKTFEASTLMGLAVGKDAFHDDALALMEYMGHEIQNMADDAPHANYIHTSCARVCQILREDFEPYLAVIYPPLLKAAKLPSGLLELEEGENIEDLPDGVEAWQQLDIADQRFAIKTSTIEEKRAANDMLIIYCQQLGGKFASQVEEIMELAKKNLGYYFEENIRISAATIMADLIHSYRQSDEFGEDAAVALWSNIYPEFISQTSKEPDLEVMVAKLSGVGRCVSELEARALDEGFLAQLFVLLKKIVKEYNDRAAERWQQRHEDDDFDDEAEVALTEEEEYDYDVMGEVCDLLHLILGYGETHVKPYFVEALEGDSAFLEDILPLLQEGRQAADLKWAISIFDDIVEHWGAESLDVAEPFLEPIMAGISHADPEVRQACIYGIGVMSGIEEYVKGFEAMNLFETAIQSILAVIEAEDAHDELNVDATENAVSAYVKIARNVYVPMGTINEDELLGQLVSWLPISEDEEEGVYLYTWIFEKLAENNTVVSEGENLNHLVATFAQVIGTIVMPLGGDLCNKAAFFLQNIAEAGSDASAVLTKLCEDGDVAEKIELAIEAASKGEESTA
eukprot:m.185861 g.185861  ORF g.185861 m.185861 type:complete len:1148 (-) comp13608_c0_seq2:1764-5207(-)